MLPGPITYHTKLAINLFKRWQVNRNFGTSYFKGYCVDMSNLWHRDPSQSRKSFRIQRVHVFQIREFYGLYHVITVEADLPRDIGDLGNNKVFGEFAAEVCTSHERSTLLLGEVFILDFGSKVEGASFGKTLLGNDF
jgi:hypothetical protein